MAQPSSNTLGLLAKHYTRILSRWPKDPLRPDVQISSLLTARQASLRNMTEKNASTEMRNVNALYSLLDDRYSKRYPIPQKLLTPEANPNHYKAVIKEIEEAPTRTRTQSLWLRIIGKIRLRWQR